MLLTMALVGCQGSDAETTSTSTSTTAPASTATTAPATTSTSETSATSTTAATPTTGGPVVIGRGQEHRVATSESSTTVECQGGGEVYVLADGSDVIITGDCTEIDLLGSGNTVEIA